MSYPGYPPPGGVPPPYGQAPGYPPQPGYPQAGAPGYPPPGGEAPPPGGYPGYPPPGAYPGYPAPGGAPPGYPAPGGAPPGYPPPGGAPGYGQPGYGAPPPGYGVPPPGGAPGYGAPPPGYGAPPPGGAPGYGAPPPGGAPGYGVPPPGGAPGYPPPGGYPGYGAPPAAYGTPPPGYGAPPPAGYGQPPYGAPPPAGYPGYGGAAVPPPGGMMGSAGGSTLGLIPPVWPDARPQSVSGFTGVADAQALRKAMKGFGTDEAALIAVLGNRTHEQIMVIKRAFAQEFQRDLFKDLTSETSGHFQMCLKRMVMSRGELDAKIIREAVEGLGTDEGPIIETICTRNRADIAELKEAYQRSYRTTVESDIRGDFSGNIKTLLLAVLAGNREDNGAPIDRSEVERCAEELYAAGEKRWGTNEGAFIKMLTTKPPLFIEALSDCYAQRHGHDLKWVVESEFSGNLKEALLALSQPPAEYLAHRIYNSMIGAGTNDVKLIRLIVTRRGRDLSVIKKAFLKRYGKTIEQMVKNDTSGDYKEMLCSLLRSEPGA